MIQLSLAGSAKGRRKRRRDFVLKTGLALLGVGVWLYVLLTRPSEDLPELGVEFGWAAAAAIASAVAYAFLAEPLTRALSRQRRRQVMAIRIEWERVARTRVRDEQLDLLDIEGRRVGSIHHQDPNANAILLRVVEITNRMRPPAIEIPHRIRGSIFAGQPGVLWFIYLVGAVATTLAFLDGTWSVGLVMLGLLLVPLAMLEAVHVLRLDLTGDELVLRYVWKTHRLPRERVRRVSIAFESVENRAKRLVTSVSVAGHKPVEVTPEGADHLEVYRAVLAWLHVPRLEPERPAEVGDHVIPLGG